MISSRELELKTKSYKSILGIVKAMKALSAANVRKGSSTLGYTRRYREFIDSSVSLATTFPGVSISSPGRRKLLVAFGSQYGLCGAFNERVLESVEEAEEELGEVVGLVLVGRRFADLAQAVYKAEPGKPVEVVEAPGSVDGLAETINVLLETLYIKYKNDEFDEMYFVFPSFVNDALFLQRRVALPPPFMPHEDGPEPPLLYIPPSEVMEGLVEEYLYVNLFSTALETVIAENESRMRSMDYAQRSIKKKVEELATSYNYALQEEITSELLEIIGGYEALRGDRA